MAADPGRDRPGDPGQGPGPRRRGRPGELPATRRWRSTWCPRSASRPPTPPS
ncbi:MAG: hypothetical protein M0C28_22990 [Candidatus Moduliflexus flocculans]|nr:hypothetical protein [Candidatus Moduliflexus flocculans]